MLLIILCVLQYSVFSDDSEMLTLLFKEVTLKGSALLVQAGVYEQCITVNSTSLSGIVCYDKLTLLLAAGAASLLSRCGPLHNLLLLAGELLVKLLTEWKILQTTESICSENHYSMT